MGGLKPQISNIICLFKSQTLKDAICLACMRDDQQTKQWRFTRKIQALVALPLAIWPHLVHKQPPSAGCHGRKCSIDQTNDFALIAISSLQQVTNARNPEYCCFIAKKTTLMLTPMEPQWLYRQKNHRDPKSCSMPCWDGQHQRQFKSQQLSAHTR